MKLIIDIPEEIYNNACAANNTWNMRMAGFVCAAIANGTPLPKGHGKLKDMGNLKYVFDLTTDNPIYSGKDIERAIKSMTTIIEADKESEE